MAVGKNARSTPVPVAVTGVSPDVPLEALRRIYAATLHADAWPRILDALAPVFGTGKVMFFQVDRLCPSASVTEGIGLEPEILQAMRERKLEEDYMWQAALRLPAGTVFRSDDLYPSQVLYRGPLYERIAVPAGIDHVLSANLENSPAFFSNVCLLQGRKAFADAAKETFGLLVPHLQAVLEIARRVATADAGRHESLRNFDRLRQPLVVLDRSGYAIHCNDSARRFLARNSGLQLKFGRFLFDNVDQQREFEHAVRVSTTAAGANAAPRPQMIRVTSGKPGPPGALYIVPVHRPEDRALMPDGAGCMVLMHDHEIPEELPVERLAWLYRLTAAEGRICDALYRYGSVERTAEQLHLTQHTVRSHLKSIYAKFGVATQGQLMMRLANAIRLTEGVERPETDEAAQR